MTRRGWVGSVVLLWTVLVIFVALGAWKYQTLQAGFAAGQGAFEPMEAVLPAVVKAIEHHERTTAIGTVLAIRSITLRNELPGTVRQVRLVPGQVVDGGALLVGLDVSVEEADLRAQEAQATLARSVLKRRTNLHQDLATTQEEVDRARADLEIISAQIARTKAVIARKTIRAPFRARVGIADVHPGQYLNEGTALTTLQGVEDAVHVDFPVAQHIAAELHEGSMVDAFVAGRPEPIPARIVALDARVDPATRNAMVRARIEGLAHAPAPGASLRIQVPVGPARSVVTIPVSALRKGPGGDQVFVIQPDEQGNLRARLRLVESGAMVGDDIVIHRGLAAGEQVAASGSFKLHDGVLVGLPPESGAAPGASAPVAGG